MAEHRVDLCVIGAGSGGLTVAAGAAQMGASVVLIERGRMGGDCLNTGCVPSKALIAAARAAEEIRRAGRFGIRTGPPEIDFAAVHAHVHGVIAAIAPVDSQERYEGLGVTVIRASARFTGPRSVAAGEHCIRARRIVIATGSSPAIPPIPGLDGVPYLTNESVFDLTALPGHLIVLGGGPIGAELAQAFRRLGARVTVVEMARMLGRDDPELAELVARSLARDGVEILEQTRAVSVARDEGGVAVTVAGEGGERRIAGSHILVAAGRRPTLDGLDLEAAGVAHTGAGVTVDAGLRSTNRRIYAVGDVAGGLQFTHLAAHHAAIVLRRALFRLPAQASATVPWVTYTSPELAQVGLDERAAAERHGSIRILRFPFADNDRAVAERAADGLVKVITTARGRVLGAGIVGEHAGELILPWALAVARRRPIREMAGIVAPYPTRSEASKRAAGAFFAPMLFSARTRRIVRFLARFG